MSGTDGASPASPSCASESGSLPTRRDVQRIKPRLVNVSERFRERLQQTKQALDKETTERKREAPVHQKMLETRAEMLSDALRAGIDALSEETTALIEPLHN